MANTPYENFFLASIVEDQFNSHLDLARFVTVDTSLQGTAGMKKIVNVYSATDGTEKLTQGQGNSKSITAGFTQKEYEILLAQNRFEWFDEEDMKDPQLVPVGMKHAGTDLFNTMNADIFAEYKKGSLTVPASAPNFDAFVDAVAKMNVENDENIEIFAFVNPENKAAVRKALKDELKYVEAYARAGYIGSVAGVNIYDKKDADKGEIIVATKEAVRLLVKTGTEVEQHTKGNRSEEYANIRKNDVISRKYYVAALDNDTKVVRIQLGA
jgi:hypothetical protein